jgi:hypothetical protein
MPARRQIPEAVQNKIRQRLRDAGIDPDQL